MIVISGSQFVYVDVDDTCLMWNWPDTNDVKDWVELDPWGTGEKVKLAVNTSMIEQIKNYSLRGHTIIVWSQGGWKWAKTAVEALNIEKYVTAIIEKPTWVYDDKTVDQFMPKAIWLGKKDWLKS